MSNDKPVYFPPVQPGDKVTIRTGDPITITIEESPRARALAHFVKKVRLHIPVGLRVVVAGSDREGRIEANNSFGDVLIRWADGSAYWVKQRRIRVRGQPGQVRKLYANLQLRERN